MDKGEICSLLALAFLRKRRRGRIAVPIPFPLVDKPIINLFEL